LVGQYVQKDIDKRGGALTWARQRLQGRASPAMGSTLSSCPINAKQLPHGSVDICNVGAAEHTAKKATANAQQQLRCSKQKSANEKFSKLAQSKISKTTTRSIPAWSPTAVLTAPAVA
jgi:hypothetical protein